MLTMAGGAELLSMFCRAIRPPKVTLVSEHEASSMCALGAPALAHSASSSASLSAPATVPGFEHALLPVGWTWVKLPPV